MKKYSADDFRKGIKKAVRLEIISSDKIRDQQIAQIFENIRGSRFKVFVVGINPKVAKGIGSIFRVSVEIDGGHQRLAFQYFDGILRNINIHILHLTSFNCIIKMKEKKLNVEKSVN